MQLPLFDIPSVLRNRAKMLGDVGDAWLMSVGETLALLAEQWSLQVGAQLSGGSEALVFAVTSAEHTPAVLKLGLPNNLTTETRILRLANGVGYAKLLAADEAHNAMLLERLGPKLADSTLPLDDQLAILCQTLSAAWHPIDSSYGLQTGAEKARSLADFVASRWAQFDQPCSRAVLDRALAFAAEREQAFDPASSVLIHGDSHEYNTLAASGIGVHGLPLYKFVDPDGMFAEPALDLAIAMRSWTDELLAGDTWALGQARCQRLSELTDVPCEPIWQWACVEYLSTGLHLLELDMPDAARDHLAIAECWLRA